MRPRFLSRIWTLVMAALFCVTALPCYAATYYVSPNGSDSSDGKSLAQPWLKLVTAISRLSNGDTLYLRGGTYNKFTDMVRIDKANVTLAAYKNEVPVIDGALNGVRKKPTGDLPKPALYKPLVNVVADGVKLYGLTVINSRGIGISLEHTKNSKAVNCTVKHTNDAAIKVGYQNIEGNNEANGCIAMYGNQARENGDYNDWTNIGQVVQLKGSYNTVKNCVVAYGPCAGIEGYMDEYSTVENNIVYGNGFTQIHFARSLNATIRYNLLYGAPRPRPNTIPAGKSWNSDGYGTGIELMCELWYDNSNWDKGHVAYGNVIANTKLGMRIGWQKGRKPDDPSNLYNKIREITLYNNTVIEPSRVLTGSQLCHGLAILDDGHLGTGNIVRNNIFWQSSGEPAFGVSTSSKIDMGHNLWNKKPASGFQRSTDPTAGASYPTLKMADYFSKTSGWNSLAGDSLTGEEFNLLATAKYAINTGTSTPTASAEGVTISFHKLPDNDDKIEIGSTEIPLPDLFATADQNKYGNWDVGAVVYIPGGAVADDSVDDSESDKEIPAPVLTITSQN